MNPRYAIPANQPNFSSKAVLVLATLFSLASTGCKQEKQLGEMHDSTQEMNGQMKGMAGDTHTMNGQMTGMAGDTHAMNGQMTGMAGDTKEMNGQMKDLAHQTQLLHDLTQGLNSLTGELFDSGKQGASLQVREELLKAMVKANSQVVRLSKAAKFLSSFEYQVWSGLGSDTPELRAKLATEAASEFMAEIQAFVRQGEKDTNPAAMPEIVKVIRKMTPAGGDTSMGDDLDQDSVFNALAINLHRLNRKQDQLVRTKSLTPINMYSMIVDALTAKSDIESGKKKVADFPGYVGEILNFEDTAVLLLQARHNALSMLALIQLSKLHESFQSAAEAMSSGPWTLGTDGLNSVAIENASSFLKGAIQTRKVLEGLAKQDRLFMQNQGGDSTQSKFDPVTNDALANFWKNAQLTKEMEATLSRSSKGASGERATALTEFVRVFQITKNGTATPAVAQK